MIEELVEDQLSFLFGHVGHWSHAQFTTQNDPHEGWHCFPCWLKPLSNQLVDPAKMVLHVFVTWF